MSNPSVPNPFFPDWLLTHTSNSGRPLCWGSGLDEAHLLQCLREDNPEALHLYLDSIDPRLSLKVAREMELLRAHARGIKIDRHSLSSPPTKSWRYNHPLDLGPDPELAIQLAAPLPSLNANMAFIVAGGSRYFIPDPVRESIPRDGARPILASLLLEGQVGSIMLAMQMLAIGMVRGIVLAHMPKQQLVELEEMESLEAIHVDDLKSRLILDAETTP